MTEQPYPVRSFFGDIWRFLNGYQALFSICLLVRLASELGPFLIAFLLGKVLDFFTSYQSGDSLALFYYLVAGIALTGIVQVWMRTYSKTAIGVVGARARQRARQLAVNKLMDLEMAWHESEDTGSKIQRVNAGSQHIYRLFSSLLANNGSVVFIGIIGSIGLFSLIGWEYALFALVYAGIYMSIEYYHNRKHSYWVTELAKIDEKISGKIHESASNVLSVKSLGLRERFEKATQKHEDDYYAVWYKTKTTGHNKLKYTKSFAAVGYALFLILVGFDFVHSAITLGSILVYASYFNRLRDALDKISETTSEFIQIKSSVARLMTILGRDVFDRESSSLLAVPSDWKSIRFENVDFTYKNKKVLRNFYLIIRRGERIGIVGRSGCGKSTLVKLLLGLYTPQKGRITIDGIPLERFKHSSLTAILSVVLQDSEMFAMTLEDNITISSDRKDAYLLSKAIKVAELAAVIARMPAKLKTLIGEKGYKVSGGERQRVGIARAVYKDTSMLVLDEATSHLDSKTEAAIQAHLTHELQGKTFLIVAHRLSTLKNVDTIYVMEHGRIIEHGSFKQLIAKRGAFHQLYTLQHKKA
ncbi:ABC transporter ATP-binding protein [Candidatus Pacearchaeota archaeon]|nr:ABC transporter ATP-binding protein [Candidatus Pacearchaeota archaeon]